MVRAIDGLFTGHVTWIHDDSLLQILSLRKAKSCWTRLSTGSQCAAATVQNASYSPNSLRGTVFLQALFLSKPITIFLIVMTECVSSPEIAICPSDACCSHATIACHVSHNSHPADLGAHFSHTAHRRCVLSAAVGSCVQPAGYGAVHAVCLHRLAGRLFGPQVGADLGFWRFSRSGRG